MHESAVLTSVLKYLGHRSAVRCWRNNTGRIADRHGRVVSFGLVGSADVIGMRRGGTFLAVECKSSTGRQSEAQRNFQKMVESMGGLYLLVRDVSDLYPWFPKET